MVSRCARELIRTDWEVCTIEVLVCRGLDLQSERFRCRQEEQHEQRCADQRSSRSQSSHTLLLISHRSSLILTTPFQQSALLLFNAARGPISHIFTFTYENFLFRFLVVALNEKLEYNCMGKRSSQQKCCRSYGNACRNGWEHIRVIVVIVCDCDVHAKELNDCVDFTSGHKLVVLDKDAA
jgi:hypothetical protein